MDRRATIQAAEPAEVPTERRAAPRRRSRRRFRFNRHLVDLLTRRQRLVLAGLIVLWALGMVRAVLWWAQPGNWSSTTGMVVNSTLLAVELVILPIWFYTWLWRMKRPDPSLPVPDLRTAIVVTKAPSEPWEIVQETLEAMLSQDFPHPYDVWLADERPDAVARAWCAEHGVRISTREGVTAYHQPSWPRRTKCKEGNLAFFYDMWGYRLYDVVAQLDADHVPASDYLREMVKPFTDPLVGYVAAPSICDRNAHRSWTARGRLYAEATLHGPMQAGHSGGYAPSCIGSHYAVRTQALKEAGGLGPELAEDFTTTLLMSSYGWQGVFAVDAEAHGDGPECLADGMTQEFQWSRSMMNVLLGISRSYWDSLGLRAKLRLGFCQVWYPLFGLLMLASVVLPLVAVVLKTPLMEVSLGAFYAHVAPPMAVLVATVVWLRSLAWLRPKSALPISWEMALFQLVRWPWALLGCAHAVVARIAGREFEFKVTPKGRSGVVPLPGNVVTPYLVLAFVSALPTLVGFDAGEANGYRTLALLNALLYLTAAVAIVTLHVREHPAEVRRSVIEAIKPRIVATASCTTVIALGIMLPAVVSVTVPGPAQAEAWHEVESGRRIGLTFKAGAENPSIKWREEHLVQVNAFEQTGRVHAGLVQWFADWERPIDLDQLRAVHARGSMPQITWEPWDRRVGSYKAQPKYLLSAIARGRHDAYIRDSARRFKEFGKPVQLRLAHEMNGVWYPWSEGRYGNKSGDYVAMWRHVHDIFREEGATNVKWVWCPVTRPVVYSQYPGDEYVDIVGLAGFNGGTELPWGGWRSFHEIFNNQLESLRRLAPTKDVQISEVGTAEGGGDKAKWIMDMFEYVEARPWIRSVIWFDLFKQADFRLATSKAARQAFIEGAELIEDLVPDFEAPPLSPTPQL